MRLILFAALALVPAAARAAHAGDWVQSDALGTNLWTHNFNTNHDATIADAFGLSEFVGLHCFFADDWRVGMSLQFTEQLAPDPANGASRFTTFAFLPQVGWVFHKPFFAQITVAIPVRTGGENVIDFGLQAIFGASFPLTERVSASLALEIPFYFKLHDTVGATPLAGIAWRL